MLKRRKIILEFFSPFVLARIHTGENILCGEVKVGMRGKLRDMQRLQGFCTDFFSLDTIRQRQNEYKHKRERERERYSLPESRAVKFKFFYYAHWQRRDASKPEASATLAKVIYNYYGVLHAPTRYVRSRMRFLDATRTARKFYWFSIFSRHSAWKLEENYTCTYAAVTARYGVREMNL